MNPINWLFEVGSSIVSNTCEYLAERTPSYLIAPDNDPYLCRYYLFRRSWLGKYGKFLPSVYLHRFYRGDSDRALHDHPWGFSLSLVLTGGYKEWRWNPVEERVDESVLRPGDINIVRAKDYHRVELLEESGCWTLFISGPRVQEWSFWDPKTPKQSPILWYNYKE